MNRTLHLRRRWSCALTVMVVVLGLGGCAKLLTEAPRPLFRLNAPVQFNTPLPHSSAQIVINAPFAPEGLEPRRIAVVRTANSIDYLADGDWADRTPNMVRAVLVEAFENSRAVAAVGPDSLDLRADFEIEGDLRHFEAIYDSPTGAPVATVTLAVKLVKIPERQIVGQTIISARQPASANATPAIVEAFNGAMASVAKQVVEWTLTNPALSARRR